MDEFFNVYGARDLEEATALYTRMLMINQYSLGIVMSPGFKQDVKLLHARWEMTRKELRDTVVMTFKLEHSL